MTTLSTPLPLGGGAGTLPAPLAPTKSRPAHRAWRIAFNVSLVLLSLLLAIILGLHGYAAYRLAHPYVAPLASNPKLAIHLDYSEVTFPSIDDNSLVDGWWIPAADSRKTVVLSHGYGTNREESWVPMYDLASLLHARNYNVLMFDYGFASKTHHTPATGGRIESEQLLGAIQYARSQGSDELVVWGFSMGAGTALQAALKSDPVDAMILDSTFLPDDDTLYYNLRKQINVPKDPSVSLIRWFFPLVSGASLADIPSEQVQTTAYDFPILLIHGTADDKAPTYLAENIARAQTNALSQLWIVPGAIHEMIFRTHPEEYIARTTAFLDEVDAVAITKANTSALAAI
ncbi:alpha/beta hydrolase [Cohnella yongneupensis]|uniref:Alpha/beta hydrolase n=1 Tax=Cohnella yongneupensis TaxID=425006 RepID=A0ABW0R3F7_9BACL